MSDEVHRLIPDSFQRAVTGVSRRQVPILRETEKRKMDPAKWDAMEKVRRLMLEKGATTAQLDYNLLGQAQQQAEVLLALEAARHLRAVIEPLLPYGSGKKLPIVDTGVEEHRSLALVELMNYAPLIMSLLQQRVSPSLQNFSESYVRGSQTESTSTRSIVFALGIRNAEGIVRWDLGANSSAPILPLTKH